MRAETALDCAALLTLAAVAVTLLRLAMLAVNGTDLFVDEAQYWAWSRDLAGGYFSKPPLIAWVIRAATVLGGSADPFWVRAAAPVLHGVAALAVGALGARVFDARTGLWAALAWLSMPGVTFGAQVISTDTVMLPPFAVALLLWLRTVSRPDALAALGAGAVLGVAALGKYAALYAVPCAALWALADPTGRPRLRDAGLALGALAVVMAPNVAWNLLHGGVTIAHTAANAGVSSGLRPAALAGFVGAQFGVMGPLLFAAWLAAAWRGPRGPLFWFSAPILVVVALQALRAGANANWAAAAFVAATPTAVAQLARWGGRAFALSFGIGTAAAIALPLAASVPHLIPGPGGRPAFARVLGQQAYADEIAVRAATEGVALVVADNRALLAALSHGLRDHPIVVAAAPRGGAARHGWDLGPPPDKGVPALLATLGAPGDVPPGWSSARDLPPPALQPFMGARAPGLSRLEP